MKIRFTPLNRQGHAHLGLAALVLIVGFGLFGTYQLVASHADTKSNTGTIKATCTTQTSAKAKTAAAKKTDCTATPETPTTTTPASTQAPIDTEKIKVSCVNSHKLYVAKTNDCGSCLNSYVAIGGTCQASVKDFCEQAAHRVYDAKTNTCTSTCATGYVMSGTVCVTAGSAAEKIKAACTEAHKLYVTKTNTCGGCVANYVAVGDACQASVKDLCEQTIHQTYDASTNKCTGNCVAGYELNNKVCVKILSATDKMKAVCAEAHKVYVAKTNSCAGCVTGYVQITGTCQPNLKDGCEVVLHQTYDAKTNKCTGKCMAGYTLTNGACVIATNVIVAKQRECRNANQIYIASTNTCGGCVTNYSVQDGKCVLTASIQVECKGSTTCTAAQVKKYCASQYLAYDATAKKCATSCVTDYVMRDGVCVEKSEASDKMNSDLCRRLGRVWTNMTTTANSKQVPYFCSSQCLDASGSTYQDTKNNLTSYCKAKANVAGSLGADPSLNKADCQSLNRIYMSEAKLCSSRCVSGYYLLNGICNETKAHQVAVASACDEGVTPNADGTCPEDTTQNPQPTTATTVSVEKGVNQNECALLGREWVPAGKDASGHKTAGGCSTESCTQKDTKLVKSNGSYFCKGSVARINQAKCEDLHRKWVEDVQACVMADKQDTKKPGARVVNSDLCKAPYTTYVYRADQFDTCLKPSTVDHLKSVAKATGTPFVKLTTMSNAGICNLYAHKHWNGHACVKDRVIQPAPSGQGGVTSPTGDTSTQPGFQVTAAFCSSLGRPYANGTCARSCTSSANYLPGNNATAATHGYDRCVKKTSGGVSCPAPMWEVNGECVGHGGASDTRDWKKISCNEFNSKFGTSNACISMVHVGGTTGDVPACYKQGAPIYNFDTFTASKDVGNTHWYATDSCRGA